MTLGVRAVILDRTANAVFLIRHTYVPGWQLPGGGVEIGETMEEALLREVQEEANIEITERPRLMSLHSNTGASRRDHVAVYLITAFRQTSPKLPDREIAEAQFFPVDRLPDGITPGTQRRINEVIAGAEPSPHW